MAKKSFKDAIADKTDLIGKSGIKGMFSSTETDPEPPKNIDVLVAEENVPEETRQSFIVLESDMERLKDFVFHKKSTMDPLFSQKEAMHQALQLLFEKEGTFPERPDRVKKQERLRNASLRRKRAK